MAYYPDPIIEEVRATHAGLMDEFGTIEKYREALRNDPIVAA
jgi:hypothetical protein